MTTEVAWQEIVEILKLGISGLVFLFAVLGYSLLSQEQKKDKPSDKILKNIRFFMWFTLTSAMLVAGFTLLQVFLKKSGNTDACHDSFSRITSASKLPGASVDDLRKAIQTHADTCAPVVEGWE